jgi:uncharacterized protein YbjT (DUF2867 family)
VEQKQDPAARPILVVGATGRHGGTGATVARLLRDHGLPVRALTRTADDRIAPLKALGIEIATGDLHDRQSLRAAVEGVEVAYFTYPAAPGVVDAAANFASAARAAGLKRLVVMSMGASLPDTPSPFGRAYWLAEELLDWAGFSTLHLRVLGFFFENLELFHRADILGDGVIRNSFSDVPLLWITGEDAGKLAVSALLHPERFGSHAVVSPSGGYRYSHAEIARIVGQHLGRTLRHETITSEAWEERIITLGTLDNRLNATMAAHIAALGTAYRQGHPPVNDIFATATGEKPLSLLDVLESGRLSFEKTSSGGS